MTDMMHSKRHRGRRELVPPLSGCLQVKMAGRAPGRRAEDQRQVVRSPSPGHRAHSRCSLLGGRATSICWRRLQRNRRRQRQTRCAAMVMDWFPKIF